MRGVDVETVLQRAREVACGVGLADGAFVDKHHRFGKLLAEDDVLLNHGEHIGTRHVPFPLAERHPQVATQLQPFAGIDFLLDLPLLDLAVHTLVDAVFLGKTGIAAVVPLAGFPEGFEHFLFKFVCQFYHFFIMLYIFPLNSIF